VRVLRLDPAKTADIEEVTAELRKRVARDSWRTSPAFLGTFRGQIVVRQTPRGQQQIEQWLDDQEALRKPAWFGGGFSAFGF
jgi:hypothetical protein